MKHVLVLCTANVCRSPMVAGLLRARFARNGLNRTIEVGSAGIYPLTGEPADSVVVELMKERGIDISAHRSTGFTARDLADVDWILVTEEQHRQAVFHRAPQHLYKVWLLTEIVRGTGDIDDPYGEGRPAYVKVLDQVESILEEGWPTVLRHLELA